MGVKRDRGDDAVWQIDIEIGQLVLDGFDRIDRDAVAATFGQELTRVLRQYTVALTAGGATDIELASRATRLPARQLTIGMPPGQLGRALAGAVFSVLGHAGDAIQPPAPAVQPIGISRGGHGNGAGLAVPGEHAETCPPSPHRAGTEPQ